MLVLSTGTVRLSGGIGGVTGIVSTALTFGLSIVAMAYCIGERSRLPTSTRRYRCDADFQERERQDFVGYVIGQVPGAIALSAVLMAIVNNADLGTSRRRALTERFRGSVVGRYFHGAARSSWK